MLTIEEAKELLNNSIKSLPAKTIPIKKACGCKLCQDINAEVNSPPFDNSAMDGIALRFNYLIGSGPWELPIQKTIPAGVTKPISLEPEHAVKIMTGAPMPDNADTVIPVEDLVFNGDCVTIQHKPKSFQHVRLCGDDVKSGDLIFKSGTVLKPVDIGVLASLGITEVDVIPYPKITVFSTGNEIVTPGAALEYGQIYNSNDTVVSEMLSYDKFFDVAVFPPVQDDFNKLKETIFEQIGACDLIITTGGVSMGDFDFIPKVVKELDGKILFHKVKIKPGKPIFIAELRNGTKSNLRKTWLVGLPGNPVSVFIGYLTWVREILGLLIDLPYKPQIIEAELEKEFTTRGSRTKIIGVKLQPGMPVIASPITRQESGRMASMRGVEGIIRIQGGDQKLNPGDVVKVEMI